MPHTFLPHTADLRAEVVAADLEGLYQSTVDLVRDVVFGDSPAQPRERRRIELPAGPEAERLFRFVREVLILVESESLIPCGASFEGNDVRVDGEPFDPSRHHVERQVKAVTRHGLVFEQEGDRLRAELVFDL